MRPLLLPLRREGALVRTLEALRLRLLDAERAG